MKPEFQEYLTKLENMTKPLPDEKLDYAEKVLKNLEYGDLLTVATCGDSLAEYYFTGFDGCWMTGKSTKETLWCFGFAEADDIFPTNITHINRCGVGSFEFVDEGFMSAVRGRLNRKVKQKK